MGQMDLSALCTYMFSLAVTFWFVPLTFYELTLCWKNLALPAIGEYRMR